jgi:hypothetical protein
MRHHEVQKTIIHYYIGLFFIGDYQYPFCVAGSVLFDVPDCSARGNQKEDLVSRILPESQSVYGMYERGKLFKKDSPFFCDRKHEMDCACLLSNQPVCHYGNNNTGFGRRHDANEQLALLAFHTASVRSAAIVSFLQCRSVDDTSVVSALFHDDDDHLYRRYFRCDL